MQLVDEYLERLEYLPPAPTVANQLLGLFGDPDRDLDRIVQLITYDPSLTAEVLKRCNSAALGGAEPIDDMFSAITRLGFYEVYCIVTAMVASRALAIVPKGMSFDVSKLWEHSVVTAVASSSLVSQDGNLEAVAFTSGLLHDVGKLILLAIEPEPYVELMLKHGPNGPALVTAELDRFKVTHAMIGAQLLTLWKLPASVVASVKEHHDSVSDRNSMNELQLTIHLGNQIAHSLIKDFIDYPERQNEIFLDLDALKIPREKLPDIEVRINDRLSKVKSLFMQAT